MDSCVRSRYDRVVVDEPELNSVQITSITAENPEDRCCVKDGSFFCVALGGKTLDGDGELFGPWLYLLSEHLHVR